MEMFRAAKNPQTWTEKQACKLSHSITWYLCERCAIKIEGIRHLPKDCCDKIYHKIEVAWPTATKAAQFQKK